MKSRLIASIALSAAALLGTTGCALISTQATTIPYAPSDGFNPPRSGPLTVRNALIVTDAEGEGPALIAAIVNESDEEQTLRLEIGEGETAQKQEVDVPAGETVSLGDGDREALRLDPIDSLPGSTIPVFFQSGDTDGVLYEIPVLDDALDYYDDVRPSPTVTPRSGTPTPAR